MLSVVNTPLFQVEIATGTGFSYDVLAVSVCVQYSRVSRVVGSRALICAEISQEA